MLWNRRAKASPIPLAAPSIKMVLIRTDIVLLGWGTFVGVFEAALANEERILKMRTTSQFPEDVIKDLCFVFLL
jgi:hypothetical protein